MARITIGGRIAAAADPDNFGTVGCYVQKHGDTEKVYALTAGHVFRMANRAPGTQAVSDGGTVLGSLTDQCTDLTEDLEYRADVAVVAIDPANADATLPGGGTLSSIRGTAGLVPNMDVSVIGAKSGDVRGKIWTWSEVVTVQIVDPAINSPRDFAGIILCTSHFTAPGDSGAPVLDDGGRLVGFVLGSAPAPNLPDGPAAGELVTVVMPANVVLTTHEIFDLLQAIPAEAKPPAPIPIPAAGAGAFVSATAPARTIRIYQRADGTRVRRTGGSLAWRNTNPGNIEAGNFTSGAGAIGSDGRYAIFPSEDIGKRAVQLLLSGPAYRALSLRSAMLKYAPPADNNDTEAYIAHIVALTGIPANAVLQTLTSAQLTSVVNAIQRHEGWTPGTETTA